MIQAIYNILSNHATLKTLLGGTLTEPPRLYPLILPQTAALPAMTMQVVSNNPTYCKEGRQEDEYRLSLNVFTESYSKAQEIGDITKDILDQLKGTYAGIEITKIKLLNEIDLYEKGAEDFHKVIDFKVNVKLV